MAAGVACVGDRDLQSPVAPADPLFDVDAATRVVAQPLGDLEGGTGNANAINSGGVIAGESRPQVDSDCVWRPVTWEGGLLRDLGLPDGYCSGGALAVSDAGHVAIQAVGAQGMHSFVWSAAGGYSQVDGDASSSIPRGVNAAGSVVGGFLAPEGMDQPFRWTAQDGFRRLPDPGGVFATATGINNAGTAVGGSVVGTDGSSRAVTWDAAGNISVLPLPAGSWTASWGAAINDAGDVVGSLWEETAGMTVALWPAGKEPIVVGRPESLTFLEPMAITTNRLVVGHGLTRDGVARGVAWSPRWGFLILEPLPDGQEARAYGINNRGEVVGYSTDQGDVQKSVKWLLPPKWTTAP